MVSNRGGELNDTWKRPPSRLSSKESAGERVMSRISLNKTSSCSYVNAVLSLVTGLEESPGAGLTA